MANWSYLELTVVGPKPAVRAFDRTALDQPVLSDYVIERKGRRITDVMFEDMVFEDPVRWGRQWWCSRYRLQIKDHDPLLEVIEKASRDHPRLCFQLDVDTEHEDFQSFFLRRGRVHSVDFDASSAREAAENELSGCDEEVLDWEIEELVVERMQEQMERNWRSLIVRCLAGQSSRNRDPK